MKAKQKQQQQNKMKWEYFQIIVNNFDSLTYHKLYTYELYALILAVFQIIQTLDRITRTIYWIVN